MFFFSIGVDSNLKKVYQREREREKLSLGERREKEKEREDVVEIYRIYFLPEGMEKIESAKSNFHREENILEGKEKVDFENRWKVKSG